MIEERFEQIVTRMARAVGRRRYGATVTELWERRVDTGWCELCNDARAALAAMTADDLRVIAQTKAPADG